MHTLIAPELFERGRTSTPELSRQMAIEYDQIQTAERYYRRSARVAPSTHLLVKLAYHLTVPNHYSPLEVYRWAVERELELAAAIGITSSAQSRKPRKTNYYPNCAEYWVTHRTSSVNDAFLEPISALTDLRPLTVLYQPYILPTHWLPEGGVGKRLYSVLGLDIPAFTLMFHHWAQLNQQKPAGEREGVEGFVGRYVEPTLLYSQADTVRINQMRAVLGDTVDRIKAHTPFAVVETEERIERALLTHLDRTGQRTRPLAYDLQNLASQNRYASLAHAFPQIAAPDTKSIYQCRFLASLYWVYVSAISNLAPSDGKALVNEVRQMERNVRIRRTLEELGQYEMDVRVAYQVIQSTL